MCLFNDLRRPGDRLFSLRPTNLEAGSAALESGFTIPLWIREAIASELTWLMRH